MLGRAALAVGFEARAGLPRYLAGERVRPRAGCAGDVRERVVERTGADVEAAVELVGRELGAGFEELGGGPAVVGQEDMGSGSVSN